MMASTTMKRHELRPLRRLFSRRPRTEVSVPDRIRIPAPAPTATSATPAVAQSETSARCPACELRAYLSG